VEVGGHVQWGPPKTKAGRRTVTTVAAELLGTHIGGAAVRASGLVFPTISGQPMRRSNLRKLWQRAVAAAGLPQGWVFHELRHTAAALAIAQGAHPLAIRDRLGHSSITVTMDVKADCSRVWTRPSWRAWTRCSGGRSTMAARTGCGPGGVNGASSQVSAGRG